MQKHRRTVSFITLGCKVNQYETDGMAQLLEQAGYQKVPLSQGADVTVVNTCAVTNMAERKSRQMLHRAKAKNPGTVLVAAGCYVQNLEETLKRLPQVDVFLGNNQKQHIVEFLEQYFENHQRESHRIAIAHTSEYEEFSVRPQQAHTRAFVKIQDGCNQFCSYCIIPYVRGRVRSRAMQDILREARELAQKGYREIVLTGIHISSYGAETGNAEINLLALLRQLQEVEGLERIRLGSLEPTILTETFVQGIAGLSKVCGHFHISLQSGCDETLRRMNRRYTTAQYRAGCELLRRSYHEPALTTDVIVGFPGETAQEFEQTVAFLEELAFYEIHVFPYSVREGTNAARMKQQVTAAEKHARSARLLTLTQRQKHAYEERFVGCEEEILVEEQKEIAGQLFAIGHTRRYLRVAVPLVHCGNETVRSGGRYVGELVRMGVEDWLLMPEPRLSEEFS